jgi:hypothetical protein
MFDIYVAVVTLPLRDRNLFARESFAALMSLLVSFGIGERADK